MEIVEMGFESGVPGIISVWAPFCVLLWSNFDYKKRKRTKIE